MTYKLLAAIAFAAHKHCDQRRKEAVASPYINHPISLANVLVNEVGVDDERVLIATVLKSIHRLNSLSLEKT